MNITIGTVLVKNLSLASERVFSLLSTLSAHQDSVPWKTTLKPQSCADTILSGKGLIIFIGSCSSIDWHRITANGSLDASIIEGTFAYALKQC